VQDRASGVFRVTADQREVVDSHFGFSAGNIKTRLAPLPLNLNFPELGPSMVKSLTIANSPLVNVIVPLTTSAN
jgi:hypothetical protein